MRTFDHLARGGRLSIGGRTIRPVGKARRICGRPSRAEVQWEGPLTTATLVIPSVDDLDDLDLHVRILRKLRAKSRRAADERVMCEEIDATDAHDGVAYMLIHDPTVPSQETIEAFEQYVKQLAEALVDEHALPSVLVIVEAEHHRRVCLFRLRE